MNDTIKAQRYLITFGIPMMMIVGLIMLAHSRLFYLAPRSLSIGITFDLLITVPVIYVLLLRKSTIPKITVSFFFITGMIIASVIIPHKHQSFLVQMKTYLIPAVESGVLIYLIFKVRDIYKNYQLQRDSSFDFYSSLKAAAHRVLPGRVAAIFALEIAVFYYGFVHWKKVSLKKNEFTYHRESSAGIVLMVIILLVLTETFVLHLLIRQWSETAALILSAVSVYSGLQIFGMARSLSKRLIVIENRNLKLRFGIMAETTIALENIDSIALSSRAFHEDKHTKRLSPLGHLDASQNIIIHLRSENILYCLYGIKRTYRTIALHVDESEKFIKEINTLLQ